VEQGEAAAETARRELMEETGVEAEILGFAGFREMVMRGTGGKVERHFVILAFAARWRAGEAAPGPELAAIDWIEPEAISRFETTEGLEEIVAAARRIIAT
jgi:ADP-ribose pyrophosphatase YjhB (NUDIX family)